MNKKAFGTKKDFQKKITECFKNSIFYDKKCKNHQNFKLLKENSNKKLPNLHMAPISSSKDDSKKKFAKGFSFHLPLYVPSLLSIHSFYCHKKDSLNTNDLNKKSNEYYIIKLNSNAMTKKNFFFPKMAFKSRIKINFYNFFFT